MDVEEETRIQDIRMVRTGADCVPVWLRTELGRAFAGNEVSRLQTNFKRGNNDPLKFQVPVRGSRTFGTLTLGGGDSARGFVFTASYSQGDVLGFELKPSGVSYGLSSLAP